MTGLILIGVFFSLLILRVPVAASMGLAAFAGIVQMGYKISVFPTVFYAAIAKYTMLAIPFFILAGVIMDHAGISKRLINLANACVGHRRGGLAVVTVIVACFFAAISGSGPATVAAIGGVLIPAMSKQGYDKNFATALVASSGGIGMIIPPSIPFIIYAMLAEVSVGTMFMAGIVPGLLFGLFFVAAALLYLRKDKNLILQEKCSLHTRWQAFRSAVWALLMPVIILGGIYGGIFTPTEAAVVAVVYSVLIGKFVYKELDGKTLYECLRTTGLINGATEFMIGLSMAFASYLAMAQIPAHIASWMTSLAHSPFILLMVINVFLLVIGCFVDNIAAVIILTPILLPVVKTIGIDPIHFGLIITVNLACGFISPPYGINLFVASAISGESIEDISKAILPSFFAMVVCLLLFTYFPIFTMGLLNVLR